MNENNVSIPRVYRPLVQQNLDVLNEILPDPNLTQIDVAFGYEGTRPVFRLANGAQERVEDKLAWLVSHQLPAIVVPEPEPEKQTAKKLFSKKAAAKAPEPAPKPKSPVPAISPSVVEACGFFGVPIPPMPTATGDVEGQTLSRP